MEPEFWHERWRKGEIGFHQEAPHPALAKHWPSLGAPQGGRVLVPLCGKSHDMHWLARSGHSVVGVELSPLAVDAFFSEAGLAPTRRAEAAHEVVTHAPYDLWCGDIFSLRPAQLPDIAAVYDRASLIALPPAMRSHYAGWLAAAIAPGTPVLLITFAYDQSEMNGPPFSVTDAEVHALFSADFDIDRQAANDVWASEPGLRKRGLTGLTESVYTLRRTRD